MLKPGGSAGAHGLLRPPAATAEGLPSPQQIHLDQHRPPALPLGTEGMDSEGGSSHGSSLTHEDEALIMQQLSHLKVRTEFVFPNASR